MAASADAHLRQQLTEALDVDVALVNITGRATLESAYPVSDLAAASVAAAGAALTALMASGGIPGLAATVRRERADAWFRAGVRPVGWVAPPAWDDIAGDYEASDAWIRLHTNAQHHRNAALRVLGVEAERGVVARAVSIWNADELEAAIVAEGGCAARMRRPEEWRRHPQGEAVGQEPIVAREATDPDRAVSAWRPTHERPLAGLRVLDLTRVLAGPVSTRLLAGLGAQVLRIDPPSWDEPALAPEMTLGKRTSRLDALDPAGLAQLKRLLAEADVVVHGYRSDALERMGLGEEVRRATRPGLVDVSLDAYAGMRAAAAERPTPLPVQALDQATGYLMAAAVLAGLRDRLDHGTGSTARLSLARTAALLEDARGLPRATPTAVEEPDDGELLQTEWGPVRVLPAPLEVPGVRIGWERAPRTFGSDNPTW
jgi:hypothetical protein